MPVPLTATVSFATSVRFSMFARESDVASEKVTVESTVSVPPVSLIASPKLTM